MPECSATGISDVHYGGINSIQVHATIRLYRYGLGITPTLSKGYCDRRNVAVNFR
jgi:hypothetical protein